MHTEELLLCCCQEHIPTETYDFGSDKYCQYFSNGVEHTDMSNHCDHDTSFSLSV